MDTPEPNVGSSPDIAHNEPTGGDESDSEDHTKDKKEPSKRVVPEPTGGEESDMDGGNPKSDSKGYPKGKKKETSKRVVSESDDDEPMVPRPPPKRIFGCRIAADTTTNKIRKHEYLIGQKGTKVNKEYKDNQENWVAHDKIDYALMKYFLGKKECKHIAFQIEENNA